jgi:F-type H+-transporting ATPase subunit a
MGGVMLRWFWLVVSLSSPLMAHEPEGGHLDFYGSLFHAMGLAERWAPLGASLFASLLLFGVGVYFRRRIVSISQPRQLVQEKFSLFFLLEMIMSFLFDLCREQYGEKWGRFLPFLSTLFLFVLCSNLTGLIPGLPPATESFSVNLAMGGIVFLVYNAAGIREHGKGYIHQFMGPFLLLAPLFICLEAISHMARPLSLSFRLAANIFGDHLVLGVFSHMVPLVVPALLLFFGLLVACIQSFVFTMLTSIYISLAVSHDH